MEAYLAVLNSLWELPSSVKHLTVWVFSEVHLVQQTCSSRPTQWLTNFTRSQLLALWIVFGRLWFQAAVLQRLRFSTEGSRGGEAWLQGGAGDFSSCLLVNFSPTVCQFTQEMSEAWTTSRPFCLVLSLSELLSTQRSVCLSLTFLMSYTTLESISGCYM